MGDIAGIIIVCGGITVVAEPCFCFGLTPLLKNG